MRPGLRTASRAAAVCAFIALSIHFIYFDPIPFPMERNRSPATAAGLDGLRPGLRHLGRPLRVVRPACEEIEFRHGGAAILLLSILTYSLVREYLVRASGNDTALNSPAMMLQFISTNPWCGRKFRRGPCRLLGRLVFLFVMWLKPVLKPHGASRRSTSSWPPARCSLFHREPLEHMLLPAAVYAFCNLLARVAPRRPVSSQPCCL
jgi:hypothetical protein